MRSDNIKRHMKVHTRPPSSNLSSTTIVKKEVKTEEFDKELLDESGEILKIYKLLQRMKQSNNTVY